MDVLLLGAAAIVLLLLTIWIVWRPGTSEKQSAPQPEEGTRMIPQGDEFEDQYTSATADLSAGGVALAEAAAEADAREAEEAAGAPAPAAPEAGFAGAGPLWTADTPHPTGSATGDDAARRAPADEGAHLPASPRTIGIGAAALTGAATALVGAWLYTRRQRERNTPLNRLRRRLR